MIWGLAHVKWFSEDSAGSVLAPLSSTEWLVVVAAIVVGVILMYLVNRLMKPVDKSIDKSLKGWREWVPTVVRYSTALLIVFNFWKGYLFAPNIEYANGTLYLIISAALVLVALLLAFGILTRLSGAILLVMFALGVFVANEPVQLLDHLEYLGIGLYLMFAPTGKLSVHSHLKDPLQALSSKERLATPLLKTFVGLSLVILAFSEKLMNMTLSNDFLLEYNWNFLSSFGVSDRNFIIAAGVMEILVGLTLVLNKASRLGTLALLCIMVVTAVLLGIDEVFGHMFAVAVVAVVFVGPNNNLFDSKLSRKRSS